MSRFSDLQLPGWWLSIAPQTRTLGMLVTGASDWNWQHALWLPPIGILASLGQWSMTRAYSKGSTLVVANMQYSGIVFAAIYSLALFGDNIPALGWAGIAVILLSGLAATAHGGSAA